MIRFIVPRPFSDVKEYTRGAFGETLKELGGTFKDIIGFSADLAGSTKILEFGKKYPHLVDGNMNAFDRGYNEGTEVDFSDSHKYPEQDFHRVQPGLGYENEPIGGIITNPGNTLLKNHAASRTGYIPLWHEDKCTQCGDCDITCPDHCIVFEMRKDDKGKDNAFMLGVDYNYCKGCLRCVDICPTEALTAEVESEHDVDELRADLRRVL